MEIYGLFLFAVGFLTMAMIYAVGSLGVNINWGFTGLFNVGVAGFFAVGAYSSAVLTAPESVNHIGGFGLPVPVGIVAAMALAALVAWPVGRICLRLRSDYLAIATIGIAEILRLSVRNYQPIGGGPFGVNNIPRPFESLPAPWDQIAFLLLVVAIVGLILFLCAAGLGGALGPGAARHPRKRGCRRGRRQGCREVPAPGLHSRLGPDGPVRRPDGPLRQDHQPGRHRAAARHLPALGDADRRRRGATTRARCSARSWSGGLWTMTELLTGRLPDEWALRVGYLRIFLIGLLLQVVLQKFPGGLLPERPPTVPRD